MNEKSRQIEALLFTAGEPVTLSELSKLTNTTSADVRTCLEEISQALAGHGLSVIITDSEAQLTTSPDVSKFLAAFKQDDADKLSRAAAETLAIIAYRGPVSRGEIDAIRGVDSRAILRQLQHRSLVLQSHSPETGYTYDISTDFLAHLGLTKREDLPDFNKLSSDAVVKHLLPTDRQKV